MENPVPHCERGAATLEAAVALPVLVLLVLGMVDMGLLVFQSTQAAGAAREGARAGILRYAEADIPTSADAAAVRAAVSRRLGPRPADQPITVTIRCLGPTGATPLAGGCSSANVLNSDRLEVAVTWEHRSLSVVTLGFGAARSVSARSAMAVLGRPAGVASGT
jgi:Flp pilus assembly protein TadG